MMLQHIFFTEDILQNTGRLHDNAGIRYSNNDTPHLVMHGMPHGP